MSSRSGGDDGDGSASGGRRFSGWTGPPDDPGCYSVANTQDYIEGGQGIVYRAVLEHDRLDFGAGTAVALKQYTADDHNGRFAKLQQRGGALRGQQHPNLAVLLDVFLGPPITQVEVTDVDEHIRYCSHLWIEGESLAARCQEADPRDILAWGRDVGAGLDFLHRSPAGQFAHRDVHPKNIIITSEGRAVLLDYDLIRADEPHSVDTTIARSVYSSEKRRSGLRGAQRDDRASLAEVILYCLAGNANHTLSRKEVKTKAQAALEDHVADARSIVEILDRTSVNGRPRSVHSLYRRLAKRFLSRRWLPWFGSRTKRAITIGLVTIGLVGVGFWSLFSYVDRTVPTTVRYAFAPEVFPASNITVLRTWTLSSGPGATLSEMLQVATDAQHESFSLYEPVPTVIQIGAFKSSVALQGNHVAVYPITLGTDASTTRSYAAVLPPSHLRPAKRLVQLARQVATTETQWAQKSLLGEPSTLTNLAIESKPFDLVLGNTQTLLPVGTLTGNQTAKLSELSGAVWSSSNPHVITVNGLGEVVALNLGRSVISVQAGAHTATLAIRVVSALGPTSHYGGTHTGPHTLETVGGLTNTWTDYQDAGGQTGAQIPSGDTVTVSCRIRGFRVADGNTWWYKVATIPWNDTFYASADAFYNNGRKSGSLQSTPFVDPAVPTC